MSGRTPEELHREAQLWRDLALEELTNARGYQRAAASHPDPLRSKFALAAQLSARSARHANRQAIDRRRIERQVQAELYRFLGRLAGARKARCGRDLSDISVYR